MDQSDEQIHRILILGGGTAGWMTANLMATRWEGKKVAITLLEAPDIGIIGVGEGSTPSLKRFFSYIGIEEAEWMPECNATYKTGISFHNWSTKPGFSNYFHPFPSQLDTHTAPAFLFNAHARRHGVDVDAHPNHFFVSAQLADNKLGPKPADSFPFDVSYGYHFDAGLVGKFLHKKAAERGVEYVVGKVDSVTRSEDGNIDTLLLSDGSAISADLYVDCSGFASVLIGKALDVPFKSFSDNLFNDSAVVAPTPSDQYLHSQTISTAMKNGWRWYIPLTNRIGNGYVYSSEFCSRDEAETEFREQLGMLDSDMPVRHLKMRVGQVQHHWFKNCLAVGLSQGFIEPLEATALHLVQNTVQTFIEAYESAEFTDQNREAFNAQIGARFEGIRDYIVAHYYVNSRTDTEYWRANTANENISDALRAILECWLNGDDLTQLLAEQKLTDYYSTISWHCLLAGYGVFPPEEKLTPGNAYATQHNLEELKDFITRCSLNFCEHKANLPN
jgi:2-polyprenyl-6-methoxyphenol hydroxylase-like FAD-dependent oxidoreductase